MKNLMTQNRKAFLDVITFSEGTSTSPATKNEGYDVIVTGVDGVPEVFTDYSDHPFNKGRPPKVINHAGLKSDASGRLQFMLRDWHYYRDLLGLQNAVEYPMGAFSPDAQDQWGLELVRERGALSYIDSGDFREAITRCANIWASLPGNNYGQYENAMASLETAYQQFGGSIQAA